MAKSFKREMQETAADVFAAFGDLAQSVPLMRTVAGVYDYTTGETNVSTKKMTVKAIFIDIKENQKTLRDVQEGDMQALIAQKSLTFDPAVNDVVVYNTLNYRVEAILRDPADAVVTLHLRAPQ